MTKNTATRHGALRAASGPGPAARLKLRASPSQTMGNIPTSSPSRKPLPRRAKTPSRPVRLSRTSATASPNSSWTPCSRKSSMAKGRTTAAGPSSTSSSMNRLIPAAMAARKRAAARVQ